MTLRTQNLLLTFAGALIYGAGYLIGIVLCVAAFGTLVSNL